MTEDATDATVKKKQVQYSDKAIAAALDRTGGMVYVAAKQIGCKPSTIYRRAKVSQVVADAIENATGEFLDITEGKLKSAVINGEAWAICFTLKTKGKARGYIETNRQEISGRDGAPIEVSARVFDHGAALAALEAGSAGDLETPSEDEADSDGAAVG